MNTIKEIELDKLIPTPENPRTISKKPDAEMRALVKSIKARGVLHPVIARVHPKLPGCYDLRAGARRLQAAKIAGLKTIPVNVIELNDREAAEVTIAENKDRQDLNPLEEAKAVGLLLGYSSLEDAAATYDKTIHWIKRRAKLLDLDPCWKKVILDTNEDNYFTRWSARHFEQIARLPKSVQKSIHEELVLEEQIFPVTYGDLKRYLADNISLLAGAPWELDGDNLAIGHACNKCPKRSSGEPELFDDLDPVAKKNQPDDRCLDPECWQKKFDAYSKIALEQSQKEHGKNMVVIAYSHEESESHKNPIRDWDISPSKKGAKNAVPAFDLKAVKVRWILDPKVRETSSGNSKSQEGPTPLKERREKLQKRREVKAVGELIKILESVIESKIPNPVIESGDSEKAIMLSDTDLFCALAVFGTGKNAGERSSYEPDTDRSRKTWDILQGVPTLDAARPLLIRGLLETFLQRINPKAFSAPHTREAHKIAHYLGINFMALLANAADEIKEPAAWAKMNEDGTPKKKRPTPEEKKLAEAVRGNLSKKPAKKDAGKKTKKKKGEKNKTLK